MVLNKQICKMYDVTVKDYKTWCKQNKLRIHNRKNREIFFKELSERKTKQ